jgi:ribosomal protein S18 acetylase RimI-like enzyme
VTGTEFPQLLRPVQIRGERLTARNAVPDDAEFILSLRLDPQKNAHISPTAPDVEKQREWLADYAGIYLIFEAGHRVGCARLYDPRGKAHTWGSWILARDRPPGSALESALMVYALSAMLGFEEAYFDVRKPNQQSWGFLETLGAERIGETEIDYLYVQRASVTERMLEHHEKSFDFVW